MQPMVRTEAELYTQQNMQFFCVIVIIEAVTNNVEKRNK